MNEAQLTTILTGHMVRGSGVWIEHCREVGSLVFEVKISQGGSLGVSKIPDHQLLELWRASGEDVGRGFVHKLSDSAIGYLPLDGVAVWRGASYLLVGYFGGKNHTLAIPWRVLRPLVMADDGSRLKGVGLRYDMMVATKGVYKINI